MAKELIVYSATKASFEAQVASGDVDMSQIGVIAQTGELWVNGAYYPLIDAGNFGVKTYTVEFNLQDIVAQASRRVRETALREAIAEGKLILVPIDRYGVSSSMVATTYVDDYVYMSVTAPYSGEHYEFYIVEGEIHYEPRRYIPYDGEMIQKAGFANSIVATADGIFDGLNGLGYVVPDSRSFIEGNYDEVLATQSYVDERIPTQVATATQKVTITSSPSKNSYMANVVYEWQNSPTTVTIQSLSASDASYDNVWVIRFGCTADTRLLITPSVYWKDGVRPSFGTWGICELTFKKDTATGIYLGEWKIYA